MTREEAIKQLELLKLFDCPHLLKAKRMAISALREQEERRWIPVTERLPVEFISVIVSIPSEHPLPTVKEAYLANGCWVTKMAIFSSNDITHWMPLPEPPKEA